MTRSGQAVPAPEDDLLSESGTARDSMTAGAWTVVSRTTGVVRVVAIGAVLGPTFFANTYQLTNSLPNLIYYGFLAGSLFSALLVPALVRHIDTGDPHATGRVAGGFLGVASCGLLALAPLAVLLLPSLLAVTAVDGQVGDDQVALAQVLILLVIPQLLLYAVAGACGAVMNAHRRFALAAGAPALENLGIVAVLGLVAWQYGTDHTSVGGHPSGEVLLLGLGSTAAVGLNAGAQWWGARRLGVAVRPRPGWRDPEVRAVLRRTGRSLGQAGLLALQMLTLLLVANRIEGGTVAVQIALNFYYLPIAVVATPVALALMPRLSRLGDPRHEVEFADTLTRGLVLALFVTVPAAVGYAVLADPVAHVVAAGEMNSPAGVSLIAGSLAALSIGLVGQTTFLVAMQAPYAQENTGRPARSMAVQTLIYFGLIAAVVTSGTDDLVGWACAAYAIAALCGGGHLLVAVRRRRGRRDRAQGQRLWPALLRTATAALLMAIPVALVSDRIAAAVAGRAGWAAALVGGAFVGLATYGALSALLRAPELGWITAALRRRGSGVAVEPEVLTTP